MTYDTLISTTSLARYMADPDWVIVDSRFLLADPSRGRHEYLQAHIPGAVYAHLEEQLSGKVIPGVTGRHPLPEVSAIQQTFAEMGIGPGVQVVAYDDMGGSMAAARVWWLLRWLGHEAVAVLDGGWPRWKSEGRPAMGGEEHNEPRRFPVSVQSNMVVDADQVDAMRNDPNFRVIDSRTADRFHGQNETIDPIAGHIPGAVSCPYPGNLTREGTFQLPDRLRSRFERILDGVPASRTVFYCGSGVTAAHNLLALKHAGLGDALLYDGWSDWITDPSRPVET